MEENKKIKKEESLIVRLGYIVILLGLMVLFITIFVTILIPFFGGKDIIIELLRASVFFSISGAFIFAGLLMYFLPRLDRKLE